MLRATVDPAQGRAPDPQEAWAALDALISLGKRAAPAVPTLTQVLRYRDSDEDRKKAQVAVQCLIKTHGFDQVRRMKLRVVEILRNVGPAAAAGKPRLNKMHAGSDLLLAYRSARALRSIAGK